MDELRETIQPAPELRGTLRADVAIVGGGYVGLWTAIHIKQLLPSCIVAVLEADICGGGASGRNGGFVLSWAPKFCTLSKLFGVEEALQIVSDSISAIDELAGFAADHNIDADFRKGGWLWTATSNAQLGAWESVLRLSERHALSFFRRLDSKDVVAMSGSSAHFAGVYDSSAAIVQPASLVLGLRRVALQLGIKLFENTPVLGFTQSSPVKVRCKKGMLRADKLVLATNAWSASIPELSRSITVISSDMIATEPIPEKLEEIGWHRDLAITDSQTMVDYYRVTRDGRVAFGKGGWTIAYGGRINHDFDHNPARTKEVIRDFRRYYPQLKDARIEHEWAGPIDRTPDSLPLFGYLGKNKSICYGIGWSGNGVGPSLIGGRILAALALNVNNRWSRYPLVGRKATKFPPEPFRFIGAHFVRAAVTRKERAEIENRTPPKLAVRIAKFAPSGLEDK